jgi:hypothetical protein
MYPNANTPQGRPGAQARSVAVLPPVEPVRLWLLTAILYNPPILIGYLLYLYGPSQRCVAGPICQFGTYPGYLQIILLLAGAYMLWLLMVVGVRRLLVWPGWQARPARALRAISEYESVRELLGVLGVLLMVAMVLALLGHRLTPTTLILGAFTAGVAIRAAFVRDDPALAQSHAGFVVARPAAPLALQPAAPEVSAPVYQTPANVAPSAPYGSSAPFASSGPFGTPAPSAQSLPYQTPSSDAPEVPPEFLPPPELLAPPDVTQPSRWEGQEL